MGRARWWILITLCACASDTTQMSAPDLAFVCRYGCPNCEAPRGACSAGESCSFGFEMDCSCHCGEWFCLDDGANPIRGCNGLVNCYIDCSQNNSGQWCYDTCKASASPCSLDLFNAFSDCIDANCYKALDADSGMPFCDEAAPGVGAACNDCYNRI